LTFSVRKKKKGEKGRKKKGPRGGRGEEREGPVLQNDLCRLDKKSQEKHQRGKGREERRGLFKGAEQLFDMSMSACRKEGGSVGKGGGGGEIGPLASVAPFARKGGKGKKREGRGGSFSFLLYPWRGGSKVGGGEKKGCKEEKRGKSPPPIYGPTEKKGVRGREKRNGGTRKKRSLIQLNFQSLSKP